MPERVKIRTPKKAKNRSPAKPSRIRFCRIGVGNPDLPTGNENCGIFIILLAKFSYMRYNVDMAEFFSHSEGETLEFAKQYAKTLKRGDIVLLIGDMGAGKTAFTKGLAKGLGVTEEVTSPTYAYMNSYSDLLFHYDCYRISSERQAENLGLTDYFDAGGICVIEWSENIAGLLPPHCKKVTIQKLGENERKILT